MAHKDIVRWRNEETLKPMLRCIQEFTIKNSSLLCYFCENIFDCRVKNSHQLWFILCCRSNVICFQMHFCLFLNKIFHLSQLWRLTKYLFGLHFCENFTLHNLSKDYEWNIIQIHLKSIKDFFYFPSHFISYKIWMITYSLLIKI